MTRSLPRFTVRRLILAVAIASVIFEIELCRRRYPHCQSLAARAAEVEAFHRYLAASHERIASLYRWHAADPGGSFRYHHQQAMIFATAARGELANAERASGRSRAYRRAAFLPWLAITPDDLGSVGLSLREETDQGASIALPGMAVSRSVPAIRGRAGSNGTSPAIR